MPKFFNRGALLAAAVSSSSILIFLHGVIGPHYAPAITAGFMVLSTASLGFSIDFPRTRPTIVDAIFAVFAVEVCASFAVNGLPETKELALFIISMAAYPAARLMPTTPFRLSFAICTAMVVLVGSALTAQALWRDWDSPHGKPFIFGFDHAPVLFLNSFGFLLIAVTVMAKLDRRITLWLSVPTLVVCALFSASIVRFTFVAILVALALVAALSGRMQRNHIAFIGAAIVFGIIAGQLGRHEITSRFWQYIPGITTTAMASVGPPAETCADIMDSIAIRRALVRDGVKAIPSAGLFGIGLGQFEGITCAATGAHNSYLEAVVELGWLGGLTLLALTISALRLLWPLTYSSAEYRFVFCGLFYVVVVCLAYGSLSHDALLFLFLGYASKLSSAHKYLSRLA